MLKYITDYIADLHYFLTITSKIITIATTTAKNVVAGAYVVINLERVMLAAGHIFQKLKQ